MFEVGFTELLVIFVLALIVLGPEKLPRLASQVGRWIGRARAMAKQFRDQLEDEVNVADVNKWQQSSQSQPPPAQPAGTPESPAPETPAHESAPVHDTTASDPSHTNSPSSGSATADAADNTNASNGHDSGPPPEPEAPVYQPPAYASSPGEAEHSNSTPQDRNTSDTDERPMRPGDVITQTHERGT